MSWATYIDEAGTHSSSPIMSMGGFLATAEKWQAFDRSWGVLLASSNIDCVHAIDLIQRRGQFRGWNNRRHNDLVLGAHELINRHLEAGFVAVLRKDDYTKHYRAEPRPRKLPQDTQYGVLFRACVSISLAVLLHENETAAAGYTVNFVLEDGAKNRGDARRLYELFKTSREADPVMKRMLGPALGLANKRASPGCQVADLMLGAAYRMDLSEHGAAPSAIEESSFARADAPITPNEIPTFRLPVGRDALVSLREGLLMEEEARRLYAQMLLEQSRGR